MAKAATYKVYTGSAWEELTFTPSSHTHSQYLTSTSSVSEAYLAWGGKNFAGSYGPVDACLIPELGANRLAFTDAAAIIVEYSTDAGQTWTTYSTTDANKVNLFNGNSSSYYIGGSSAKNINKTNYQVRFTINTSGEIYTVLNKFCILVSTNGSSGCWCTIDARLQSNYEAGTNTWKVFANKVTVSGWSGYNIINTSGITTYGNTKTSQYGQVRFTFGVTSHASSVTSNGLSIMKIMGFGGVGWTTPSTMAKTGQMYTYDYVKNVTFPAAVKATSFVENGTELSSKYAALANTIKALSISGKTITYTKGDGTTGTLTTQDTTYSVVTASQTGTNSGLVLASEKYVWNNKQDKLTAGSNITINNNTISATNTTYSKATSSALGLVKIGYSENGKNYPVELDSDGKMFVNVPWTDTDNNTTYSQATSSTLGLVKIGYTTSGKNYAVQLDSNGKMFVNVPWTDTDNNTTYSIATASKAGLVKPVSVITKPTLQSVTTTAGKYYQVQMSSDGNMFVNVPWTDNNTTYTFSNKAATLSWGTTTTIATVGGTDITVKMPANPDTNTTYSKATSSALGLVKIGYTENGKNYPVELNSDGQMFVNVPWTDTTTTVSYTQTHTTSSHSSGYEKIGSIGGTDVLVGKAGGGSFGVIATGSNITNTNGTISLTKDNVVSALGYTPPTTNTTYSNATTSAAGLMSADDKKNLTYYVKGTQTASTNAWTGSLTQISALYEGLTIRYRLPYAGTSSGATLNLTLSGGTTGAKKVYRYGTSTQITTHFAAGSVITMTYNGTDWIADAFYDSNSYAYVRQYTTTTNAEYPLLFAYETTLPSSYDTKYTRKNSNLTFNPSTGTLNATILSEGGTALNSKYATINYVDSTLSGIGGGPFIDLGTVSTMPTSPNCTELNQTTEPGMYVGMESSGICFTVTVTHFMDVIYQTVIRYALGDMFLFCRSSSDGGATYTVTSQKNLTQDNDTKVNIHKGGSSNDNYELTFGYTAGLTSNITSVNESLRSSKKLYFSPGTGVLTVPKISDGTTTATVTELMSSGGSSGGGSDLSAIGYSDLSSLFDSECLTYALGEPGGITEMSKILVNSMKEDEDGACGFYYLPFEEIGSEYIDPSYEIATIGDVTSIAKVSTQYTLSSRSNSVSAGSTLPLASLLASYTDVMIIVRATFAANGGIAIKSTAGSTICDKKYTTTGTYYEKIIINRTSDNYCACDIGGSFGWVSGININLVVSSSSTATVVYYYR